jgi:hypothetical protein
MSNFFDSDNGCFNLILSLSKKFASDRAQLPPSPSPTTESSTLVHSIKSVEKVRQWERQLFCHCRTFSTVTMVALIQCCPCRKSSTVKEAQPTYKRSEQNFWQTYLHIFIKNWSNSRSLLIDDVERWEASTLQSTCRKEPFKQVVNSYSEHLHMSPWQWLKTPELYATRQAI